MSRCTLTRVTAVVGLGVLLSVGALKGQTTVAVPDNRYTPAEDVELGRKAAVEVEQQLPILRDEAVTPMVASIGQRLVRSIPADLRHPEFQVLVPGRQRERDQRLRAAWRADVHQSRHDRGGAHAGRGRRRDGARAQPRRAQARHGPGDQGDEIRDRHAARRARSARSSAVGSAARWRRAHSSGSVRHFCDSAASSSATPI